MDTKTKSDFRLGRRLRGLRAPSTTGPDVNITTLNSYTPDDNIADFIAVNPATGNQRTRYLYGTTLPTSSIARNDLLVAVIYPDAADSADSVQFLYNLQSEVDVMQDQNGTVHNYLRDLFGRQTSDQVITLGMGVNGAVMQIDTAYEIRGMVNQVTSYSASMTMVNDVQLFFGDFEQQVGEVQKPGGATGPTFNVGYTTNEGGTSNSIAPLSITYTDGAVFNYNYTATDDAPLNRVTTIEFAGSIVATYGYFGLASVASTTYSSGATVIAANTMASGSSYNGFDLFDRVIDLAWVSASSAILASLGYGYNLASSRTYRQDVAAGGNFDELYGYDGVERLLTLNRGTLTSGSVVPITMPKLQQTWKKKGVRTILTNDQNGTVHKYFRDLFGRQISDQVITLGMGVNDSGAPHRHGLRNPRHGLSGHQFRRPRRRDSGQSGHADLRRFRATDRRGAGQ